MLDLCYVHYSFLMIKINLKGTIATSQKQKLGQIKFVRSYVIQRGISGSNDSLTEVSRRSFLNVIKVKKIVNANQKSYVYQYYVKKLCITFNKLQI